MKKAFTLAEVMIVLTVIGVLTAILLPVARQSMSDENLMKFKKAHNTLGTVIRELVTSDKYYKDGDLGVKPDDSLVDEVNNQDYLCKTMAEIINAKTVDCVKDMPVNTDYGGGWSHQYDAKPEDFGKELDKACLVSQTHSHSIVDGKGIILENGTIFYETGVNEPFGKIDTDYNIGGRRFITRQVDPKTGFTDYYKILCIDIDGINKDENPFGYGVRYDGRILAGERALQWLERDVNEE